MVQHGRHSRDGDAGQLAALVHEAALLSRHHGGQRARDELTRRLPRALTVAETELIGALGLLWSAGWAPADLAHAARRDGGAARAAVCARAVVLDAAAHDADGTTLHPRWRDQVAALEPLAVSATDGDPAHTLVALIGALGFLLCLPPLPPTVPAPGSAAAAGPDRLAGLDSRMLARVRALLAKAESTEFPDEAEAFTTKAQELITRHTLDELLLAAPAASPTPSARRLLIDDPYASLKATLLDVVAQANRCRPAYSPTFAMLTVVGFESDLDAVELLGTSLLTQATAAMVRQGSRRDRAGRSTTRSFRRAFLLGFATRIGERLAQAAADEVAASAANDRLLPMLAAREEAVDAAAHDVFGRLTRRRTTVTNAPGWVAGRAAADAASLTADSPRLPGT